MSDAKVLDGMTTVEAMQKYLTPIEQGRFLQQLAAAKADAIKMLELSDEVAQLVWDRHLDAKGELLVSCPHCHGSGKVKYNTPYPGEGYV